jgi:RNA polymerase sigma-70 factor (ECF subfamily)
VVLEDKVTGPPGEDQRHTARRDRFEQAWQEHRPRVALLVARLAGDLDLAEDLTQEVAVRAFQAYPGFRGEAGLYTWLYLIAVNVVNRHRERGRLNLSSLDKSEVAALPADEASDPEAIVVGAELRTRVWAALDRLPDELRITLILQLYEGLKYREIATILEVPIGTVKSRLHNAVQRLKEEFVDAL